VNVITKQWQWTGSLKSWKTTERSRRGGRSPSRGKLSELPATHPLDGRYYHDPMTDWNVRVRGHVLCITGSLRRAIHPDNLLPLTTAELPAVYRYIYELKYRLGLSFTTDTLIPGRTDFAADFRLPDCASFVRELARVARFNKMDLSFGPEVYGSSIRWQSTQRQLAIYDKTKEMRDHDRKAPENLLRIEVRYMRRRSCQRAGIRTMADLQDPDKQRSLLYEVCQSLLLRAKRMGLRGTAWETLKQWIDEMEGGQQCAFKRQK
jgi:hypothetical protein